ncbi:hypothetical protein [Variovorax sp. V213]|uniref:hypothetical protein n=1 Tax=Variovorax sp. V213 TaxID=3065955 RepID=UPI0034E8901F
MDHTTAEKIHTAVSRIFEAINETLFIVNNSGDTAVRKTVQKIVGTAIADLDLEVLEPIYKQFPDLRPSDMEEVR